MKKFTLIKACTVKFSQKISTREPSFLYTLSFFLAVPTLSNADELDYIFANGNGTAKTNILFILDASTSMNEPYLYKIALQNPATNPNDPGVLALLAEKNSLESKLKNKTTLPPSLTFSTDNLHCPPEYFEEVGPVGEGVFYGCPIASVDRWFFRRIDIVRDVVRDTLPLMIGTNVGIMRTGLNNQSFIPYVENGYPTGINKRTAYPDTARDTNGAYVIQSMQEITSMDDVLGFSAALNNKYFMNVWMPGQTPLAESLYEAYQFYRGGASKWTKTVDAGWPIEHLNDIDLNAYTTPDVNGQYKSPLTECSQNHIIMMSDGLPTYDWDANSEILALAGGTLVTPVPGPGIDEVEDTKPIHSMLDELSGYLANNDLDPAMSGKQTVTTHFVSTWSADSQTAGDTTEVLDTAAAASGGFHEKITDITQLQETLSKLIGKIETAKSPAIGYNVLSTNESGNPFDDIDEAYVNIWEYKDGRWAGNLKKFKIDKNGQLVGKNNQPFVLNLYTVNPDTTNLWSNSVDGDETIKGGAAALMSPLGQNRYSIPRRSIQQNIKIKQNKFRLSPENNQINPGDVGAANQAERQKLLNWAGGADITDIDDDANTTEIRPSLGDQLNNSPTIVHYSNGAASNPVIFTGSNEGYLHAFNSKTGQHMYSFMPPHALENISSLLQSGRDKNYGIDGEIVLWHKDLNNDANIYDKNGIVDKDEKLFLFFGLRRGGSAYYALDITDRNEPELAWVLDKNSSGFARLGESWSKPQAAEIKTSLSTSMPIAIITGGLEPGFKDGTSNSPNLGNAIYIINPETGALHWSISNINSTFNVPTMLNSILGTPTLIDFNRDGYIDAFYFNDIRGQVFRCDFKIEDDKASLSCGKIAEAQAHGENLYFMSSLDVSFRRESLKNAGRSIVLSLSSGNRFEPMANTTLNRIVTIIDPYFNQIPGNYNYALNSPISLSNLTLHSESAQSAPVSPFGWYFNFPNMGEKSYSQSLTYDNKIFVSTHIPSSTTPDACGPIDFGNAHIYGFNIDDGSPVTSNTTGPQNHLLWSGKARGMPDSPYMVTNTQLNKSAGALNLGVDNADLDIQVDPLNRTYWRQSK